MLHTNDAATAITRLIDLGVADYLVASTVEEVLAQRLVRRVCSSCAEEVEISEEWRKTMGPDSAELTVAILGQGWEALRGTGYRGRTGVFELLLVDEEIRDALRRDPSAAQIRRLAVGKGTRTLKQDGIRLVAEGVTTREEILRVTLS